MEKRIEFLKEEGKVFRMCYNGDVRVRGEEIKSIQDLTKEEILEALFDSLVDEHAWDLHEHTGLDLERCKEIYLMLRFRK